MLNPVLRRRLAALHRWSALAMAPVIAVILVTGIILAFRPILGTPQDEHPSGAVLDPGRLLAVLDSIGGTADFVLVQDDRRSITVFTGPRQPPKTWELATGREVATPPFTPPDFFDKVERVHKDLWGGLGFLVTLASIAMVVLIVLGPILARPSRGRKNVLGWHIWGGWFAWPLLALLPVSLVMMKLHTPFGRRRAGPPPSIAAVLGTAARTLDLTHLDGAQRFPGGAIVVIGGVHGEGRYVVRGDSVQPLESGMSRLGKELHTGTWAGPWSGALNVVAALGLLVMLWTGTVAWVRKLRR
ncbi:MAG TPA: PepSY-associated TM helix domain-containing protein [Gemmatimonadales bacterium]|nr:PepSY-associated TM helix domain-containing protein [Gemmatimonadales bacterium]